VHRSRFCLTRPSRPILWSDRLERRGRQRGGQRRVVDEDVDRAMALLDIGDTALDIGRIRRLPV
jgi:hypothetical protein